MPMVFDLVLGAERSRRVASRHMPGGVRVALDLFEACVGQFAG